MNVRVTLLVGAAIATSACVKINDFKSDGGGSGSGSGCQDSAVACAFEVAGHVHGEVYGTYDLQFSNDGFRFPDSLSSATLELLGAPPSDCSSERGVGVAYSPAAVISSVASAATGATVDNADLQIMIPGPGVAKVTIDWTSSLMHCAGNPNGRSTFTFFPDGRITRWDLTYSGSTALDVAACRCDSSSEWELSTYWSFAVANINTAQLKGFTQGFPTQNGDNREVGQVVCTPGVNHKLGIAWYGFANRVRRLDNDFALFTDLVQPTTTPLPASTPYEAITTMYITTSPDQDCNDVQSYLLPFSGDPQLEIEDTSGVVQRGVGGDGIYGGEHSGMVGTGGISFQGAPPFTLRPYNNMTIPPFAVWVNLTEITSVTRTPASQRSAWYTDQTLDGGAQHILWFPDGLAPGEQIVIEAP